MNRVSVPAPSPSRVASSCESARKALIFNNIFYEPNGPSMNFLGQPRDTVIDHNCYFARYGKMPGDNSIKADPRFTRPAELDFRLARNRPGINAGRVMAGGRIDRAGLKIPQGPQPDIGAFEFPFQ